MKKLHSLRVAILAVIIPIIAAALALSSIYAYSTARKITETTINDEIKAGLQVALERIDKSLQKNAKVSQALAKGVEAAYPTASESYYENLLTGIIATNDETFGGGIWFEPYAFQKSQQYFSPYCMRVDGKVTYQDGYNLGEGVYYTDQDWYTNVNSSSGSVWSAPYYDDFAKVSMVTSSSPILDPTGALIGVATTDIDLTQIQEVVNQLRVNGMGRAFLIDTEGTYVGDEDSSKLLNKKIQEEENSSFASLGQQMLTQNTGSGSYKDGNETYFVQYAPVEGSPLIAAVVLSETDMYGQVYQLRVQMAAFSIVITILLSLFIVLYLSKAVVRPLNKLAKSTQAIADGNLDVSVDCTSNNEIGVISHALQSTITRLSQYIAYIEEISAVLNKIAAGNLSIQLTHDYTGEFFRLKESILNISASLKETIGEINRSADQVGNSSIQVANGAQTLSQGSAEQAGSIERLSTTIRTISDQINGNATNAGHASQQINLIVEEAQESNTRMEEMLTAMSDISNSSSEIAKIIKTIEDIAFQTNILALNAAVEAARAGEAGKGFAVVADEVRSLAEKSANASKETAALIEASLKSVEKGRQIADATAISMSSVVNGVVEITDTIAEITTASNDQAQSVDQVTAGMEQISKVVQTTSATAQESAAASEELSSQAQNLKTYVDKFHL